MAKTYVDLNMNMGILLLAIFTIGACASLVLWQGGEYAASLGYKEHVSFTSGENLQNVAFGLVGIVVLAIIARNSYRRMILPTEVRK
jgi:hypothetical protein